MTVKQRQPTERTRYQPHVLGTKKKQQKHSIPQKSYFLMSLTLNLALLSNTGLAERNKSFPCLSQLSISQKIKVHRSLHED